MSKIYPKHIEGRFRKAKNAISVSLQALLFITPWITLRGRPIVNIDLAGSRLHLLGHTYWPQETHFLLILTLASGVLLFLTSAVLGRIWCGFACPHTLFSHAFIWVERFFEGDRYKRIRLDLKPWPEKLPTKLKKWSVWLVMSVYLGLTFAGYFAPIREVVTDLINGELTPFFWGLILFFTVISMLMFGVIRSRFCTTICPYARFQSAMTTENTRMVNYDHLRGEPRGKKKDPNAADCVDCNSCVTVCPMGIDIRDGFQFACINCASCIDACDKTMDSVGRDRGLIRFASLAEIDEEANKQVSMQEWLRSLGLRPLIYLVILGILSSLFVYLTATRPPFAFQAHRDGSNQGVSQSFDGRLTNRYSLRITNRDRESLTIDIAVLGGPDDLELVTATNPITIGPEEIKTVDIMLLANPDKTAKSVPIEFILTSGKTRLVHRSTFISGVSHAR